MGLLPGSLRVPQAGQPRRGGRLMKVLGRVLYGLGIFLLVLAPLLRFYAYPHLAVVPIDQVSDTTSVGPNSTVFYLDGLTVKNGVELTYKRRVIGNVAESNKAGGNIAVWDTFSAGTDA